MATTVMTSEYLSRLTVEQIAKLIQCAEDGEVVEIETQDGKRVDIRQHFKDKSH